MKKELSIFFGLCLIIALFSCEKDANTPLTDNPNKVGANLTDTFSITTYSVMEDSVKSSERSSPMLGVFHSELTGLSKSSIFATLKPDSLDRVYPSTNYQVDSFFLELHITDQYGTDDSIEFEVYQLSEQVNNDSTYYGFDTLSLGEKIGEFKMNVTDSGTYYFNLDTSKASLLMNTDLSSTASNADFYEFFNGIAIVPKSNSLNNSGKIYQLNRIGIAVHLWFHTTNNTDDLYDLQSKFDLESDNFIFANYDHEINNSNLEMIIGDSTLGQDFFIAQGMQGGIGKIKFPSIQNWYSTNGNILINQFELTISSESNSNFPLPEQLIFTYLSSENIRTFSTGVLENNSYSFSISPSEVDKQLKANTFDNMDFEILIPTPGSTPNITKIYGVNHTNQPKISVSYTTY